MGIHPMFNVDQLNIYQELMLDDNEEEYVAVTLTKQVSKVGMELNVDALIQCKHHAIDKEI